MELIKIYGYLLLLIIIFVVISILITKIPLIQKRISNNKFEITFLFVLIAIYSVISFYRLGSFSFVQTTWQPTTKDQEIIFDLKEETYIDEMKLIYSEGDNNALHSGFQLGIDDLVIQASTDKLHWQALDKIQDDGIYHYNSLSIQSKFRYIKLISQNMRNTISEIAFFQGNRLLDIVVDQDLQKDSNYPATLMIDEQNIIQKYPNYLDEAYFDEVYYPRYANEIVHQQYMYPAVHPQLGNLFIAISIKLFGNHPFAWRFMQALFGILQIPFLYLILKRIFKKTAPVLLGTTLFCVDFMHITTSRISTLDPFNLFWILVMTYFMICFIQTSIINTSLKKQITYLFASALAMSLGIATKWPVCYSAVGLAILFFYHLYCEIKHYPPYLKELLFKRIAIIIMLCILFFILMPCIIYIIPYMFTPVSKEGFSIHTVIDQIVYSYRYHINLTATHPFQSTWYQWIFDLRPIWYFGREINNIYYTIACFSNPLICWMGVIAFFFTLYRAIFKKEQHAIIVLTMYLTAILPWVSFVQRCVFSYLFYPSGTFTILLIVYFFTQTLHIKKYRKLWMIYTFITILIFFIYLPVLTGFGSSLSYVKFLEILPGWYWG